ncbi:unnamed protein product [Allacma fusca]|uniref:Uncharacterized protein n=1 Tax=Allacma fusca TaxID=39272 RepID=A0A8J2LQQ7_9HEXA|nr:unnamed protein product [Allacma fusca]
MAVKYFIIDGPPPVLQYLFLPKNDTIYKSAGFIIETLSTLTLANALIYVLCLGTILVQVHAKMLGGFQQQFLDPHFKTFEYSPKRNKIPYFTLVGTKGEAVDFGKYIWADLTEFSLEFERLTKCFDMYVHIVGPYLLAMTFQGSLYAIQFLSLVSSIVSQNKSANVHTTFVIAAFHVSALLLLTSFGNVFKQQVEDSCKKLQTSSVINECDSQVHLKHRRIADWISSWNWKLKACNLFEVNQALLLAIAGTALTYFIFIFQLQFSERSNSCYPPAQQMASTPGASK